MRGPSGRESRRGPPGHGRWAAPLAIDGHLTVSPPVQAVVRSHPDTAVMILEEGGDRIARESVGSVEEIDSSLVDVDEPAVHDGSDPKGAMAVAKQAAGLE